MSKRLQQVHERAIRFVDEVQCVLGQEREQCREDRRFYSIAGAQWEGNLGDMYENKPKFEVNKIHASIIRIINEYRNNRISAKFSGTDAVSDEVADTLTGIMRADEYDSNSDEAYDNAFEEAVGGGFGAWRLRAVYEDEENEENEYQRIVIEPIFDADTSVFFDTQAKRQDKSDAKKCIVLSSMSRDEAIEQYGDSVASVNKNTSVYFDWYQPDIIYIGEYYEVEEYKKTFVYFFDVNNVETKINEEDLTDETMEEFKNMGLFETRRRSIKSRRVRKYIISGDRVLKDCGYIAGKYIPIIPLYAKRWFIDNVERCSGHVRIEKDAQRVKNMMVSKLAEIAALSSIEKPILTDEQIAGKEGMWSEDPISNYPYLLINSLTGADGTKIPAPPVAYTRTPNVPPAMIALLQVMEGDMKEMLGNNESTEKVMTHLSGSVLDRIHNRIDMQSFIYMSNMAKAYKQSARVYQSMAKDVYIEDNRLMRSIPKEDGRVSFVGISRPLVNADGNNYIQNDIANTMLDVRVDIGLSSSSKRNSIINALTGMANVTNDQETRNIISSLMMMNLEGEGIGDVREYFRTKLVKLGAIKPTKEEEATLVNSQRQLTPEEEYMKAAANEAMAKAEKARAEVAGEVANAELLRARTVDTLASLDDKKRKAALDSIATAKTIWQEQPDLQQPRTSEEL